MGEMPWPTPPSQSSPTRGEEDEPCRAKRWARRPAKSYIGISETEWATQLQPEAISAACESVGYTMWRDRPLNPVLTVQVFLLQILHGHTACRQLPHLADFSCMDVLHGQTVPGVHKELHVFAILDKLVRLVILQSATQQQVGVEQIRFLDALRWLGAPVTDVPLEVLFVNPARPNRIEPRVKKRRPKAFPFMTKPPRTLRQALMQQTLGD